MLETQLIIYNLLFCRVGYFNFRFLDKIILFDVFFIIGEYDYLVPNDNVLSKR